MPEHMQNYVYVNKFQVNYFQDAGNSTSLFPSGLHCNHMNLIETHTVRNRILSTT